jgi:hypothetical protein
VPDTKYPFPPYDKPGIAPITEDVTIYTEVPASTKFVSVSVMFRDGTVSKTMKFSR